MQEAIARPDVTRFVGSSGGNAGMAMAVVAQKMGVPLTIYIPTSTKSFMVDKLKAHGADVVVSGNNWNEANAKAEKALEEDGTFLVHPFDQEDTWHGHSTIMDELVTQLNQKEPSCIITCIGGGGLVLGLLQGLDRHNWSHIPILAMETEGANCFDAARKAGEIVTLAGISSVATSLGALAVSNKLFQISQAEPRRILNQVVTDKEAVRACARFAQDHRMLVEPSCGATLSAIYSGKLSQVKKLPSKGDIVVIVCGGSLVNLQLMSQWSSTL